MDQQYVIAHFTSLSPYHVVTGLRLYAEWVTTALTKSGIKDPRPVINALIDGTAHVERATNRDGSIIITMKGDKKDHESDDITAPRHR